jgi:membrane-associated protease RseP (regulator of RpoE activity)
MSNKLLILTLACALAVSTQAQKQDDMKKTVEYLASQELGGRYPGTHGDTLASEYIARQLCSMKLKPIVKGKKSTGYYQDFTYGKTEKRTTHNIIAVLPGNDKILKNEYIVVGSHYDHLGLGGKDSGSRRPDTLGVHPGADDNASGDAVVLQLAKHFAKTGSPRSIIFMFFGAEEQGLVGSKMFIDWMKQTDDQRINLPNNIKGVVSMVNLDMVGRMRDNAMSVAGTGTSSQFKAMVEKIAEQQGLHVSCVADGYGASDKPGLRADIVVAGKPAHNAGIRSGDVIQEIDGKAVKDINEYMERLTELKAGTTIPVKVLRGEEIIVFQVHLTPPVR